MCNETYNRKDFEIMAPVGSFESLHAALRAGADAIYFGVGTLNMRARSSLNFTLGDLETIARECQAAGVKSYLTVNTVLFNNDLDDALQAIKAARRAGVSAIIAADLAAIEMCRREGMEVHISTQANITNTPTLKFYSQWADVCVLARELNLEQVYEIHRDIATQGITGPSGAPVRLEMFCHGALCMATSGKCYMSLHEMDTSANRGSCSQICRRAYTLTDSDTGRQIEVDGKYLMSPKDLKTINFLNKMVHAGVRVFKIEGRARGPEYVYTTVKAYSEALDAICHGTYTPQLVARLEAELEKAFNRGFWDGYYLGRRMGQWSMHYGSSATRVKNYVAKAVKYFSKLGVGEFIMEAGEINQGDEVIITGPTTGALIFTANDLRVDLKTVPRVTKGDVFSMAVPDKIRPSDRLYRWQETQKAPRHKRF